ncbi:uncharacterized protein A1O9_10829 [Exophiala aquamarina CBS 119918]|uniref:Uncharacterized protein n=1 Tax=Exophiala aquamarina CBS 119918 TaxID=1182545 RepID=A0A072P0X0_9EURO|nr:uncharacterized protein A1O9_10829 [Exophiala aquamarina CBS 119918]KEF52923.1 hypothetical protein A1O9_10829 [Exophiala aquamarina CBS 119918]
MVLLTSSAVSVVISSGVVCTFTFLLFLSGYVLQQQTVRSLQEAIRQPAERKPVPTLPAKFRHQENETVEAVIGESQDGSGRPLAIDEPLSQRPRHESGFIQVPVDMTRGEQALGNEPPGGQGQADAQQRFQSSDERLYEHLAYMFALLQPSDLCSALLFAEEHRKLSSLAVKPSVVLLYPSTWESSSRHQHTSVLKFMRDIQEQYSLIYHPVQISDSWEVNAQLLGELQWTRWGYDRALFLRSPGMATDVRALDEALASSILRKSWAPLSATSGNNPDVLLYTPKGLQIPRKEMRKLVASAVASDAYEDQVYAESRVEKSAYVLLDEELLLHNQDEDDWTRLILNKFSRGRRAVCAGSGILEDMKESDTHTNL